LRRRRRRSSSSSSSRSSSSSSSSLLMARYFVNNVAESGKLFYEVVDPLKHTLLLGFGKVADTQGAKNLLIVLVLSI